MKDYRTTALPLLVLAAALITLLSCCSWLYPLQPVDDANWYMSIGKSMLRGKLLYTDVHDQKGPLLFFLHEWAATLSPRSFLGIYLVEVTCCFGFLMLSYRTMRLFAGHGVSMAATGLVGVLTYASDFMWYGDTVEELSLPVLLLVLYQTLRYAKLGELPADRASVLTGAGVAAVFWMKFTVLAGVAGAVAALLILAWQRRQMLLLTQSLAWALAGFAALTACVLAYFVWHGNEADLYHSYFWFNIFLYTDAGKMDASAAWWPAKWLGWLVLVGGAASLRVRRDVRLAVVLSWAAALLPFCLFKVYQYYFLTAYAFAPLSIYFIRRVRSRRWLIIGTAAVSLLALGTNWNLMMLLTGRFPKAVLQLAETVNADHDPDKQVLTVVSYDTGIYTLTDCLPPVKYFSTPNAYLPELVEEQTAYLASRQAKYLIQKDDGGFNYYDDLQPDLYRDYDLIDEASDAYRAEFLLHPLEYFGSKRCVVYRLWRLKGAEASGHDAQFLVGEWETMRPDGVRCLLSFTRHGIVRCMKYEGDALMESKYYTYFMSGDTLRLGYMEAGDEYKKVRIAGHSATRLDLQGWPLKGKSQFTKQSP